MSAKKPQHALIIGAGYGGLALANILAQRGFTVEIVERGDRPGGRVGELSTAGYQFDTGPSWYLMPEVFEQYYRLFGLSADRELHLKRLTPGYKVFFEQQAPLTIQGELERDATLFESIEPGAGDALKRYVARSKETYDIALEHFLYTNFQRPHELLTRRTLSTGGRMLGAALQPLDRMVSRSFHDQRLQQLLEYHMVFLGSSPFEAPALYSLMSTLDFSSGVYYPARGMYSLIESLVAIGKQHGVSYRYGADVARIIEQGGRASGVELTNGEQLTADIVISNADLHFTETQLVPEAYRTYPEPSWRRTQPGPSALLLFLGVKGSLKTLQHHNLLFVESWKENFEAIYGSHTIPKPASIYLCNPTKTDPSLAPAGHENVFVLVPLPAGISLDDDALEALSTAYIQQISDMTGITDLPQRIAFRSVYGPDQFADEYHSWQNGALGGPSHILRQSAIFRTPNYSKKLPGLYYVGAGTTPGIGLPMCLIGAQLVYKRIVGDRTGGPLEQL